MSGYPYLGVKSVKAKNPKMVPVFAEEESNNSKQAQGVLFDDFICYQNLAGGCW